MDNISLTGKVMTVLGPVDPWELGFCHAHEHLFNDNAFAARLDPNLLIDDYDRSVQELVLFRRCGGGCVVDAQPVGCGRMAKRLALMSEASRVRVVASTGFHKLGFYPPEHWVHTMGEDELLRLFLSEAAEGMIDEGGARAAARPGVIKAAVDACGISGRYEILLSAAAECCRVTGLPLLVHLEMGRHSEEALEFLLSRGVRPSSIILCHLDRTLEDPGRFRRVAQAGAYLELDTIARFKYHGDEEEAALIRELTEAGYAGSILLGLDTTRARMKSYGGSIGLDYIAEDFLPRLGSAGVPQQAIRQFMFENPARAFAIKTI